MKHIEDIKKYGGVIDRHDNIKKFPVEITETLSRVMRMEAATPDEAVDKVKTLYRKEVVVLDSSDYIDTDFRVIGDKVTKECKQNHLIIIKNLCNSLSLEIEKNLNEPEASKFLVLIEDLVIRCQEYIRT